MALSGGGIRSACYCAGVIKALADKNLLKAFDYLSCVSGGGYAGSALISHIIGNYQEEENENGSLGLSRDTSEESDNAVGGSSDRGDKRSDQLLKKSVASLHADMLNGVGYLVNGSAFWSCLRDFLFLTIVLLVTLTAGPLMIFCISLPIALLVDILHGAFLIDALCCVDLQDCWATMLDKHFVAVVTMFAIPASCALACAVLYLASVLTKESCSSYPGAMFVSQIMVHGIFFFFFLGFALPLYSKVSTLTPNLLLAQFTMEFHVPHLDQPGPCCSHVRGDPAKPDDTKR